jgi:uncharacterized membrane protein
MKPGNLLLSFCCLATTALGQTFELLQVPDAAPRSIVGLSADGSSFAVEASDQTSWFWSSTEGFRQVPLLPGYSQAFTTGISQDGRYLSVRNLKSSSPTRQASRFDTTAWTHEPSGLFNDRSTTPGGISRDGSVLAMEVQEVLPSGISTSAARWRPGQQIEQLVFSQQTQLDIATGVSNDGRVSGYRVRSGSMRAFVADNSGSTELQTIDGSASKALAISSNGQVVVGQIGNAAAAWVNLTPMLFDPLQGFDTMLATTMSPDMVIVGGRTKLESDLASRAWMWSENTGTILLQDFLIARGVTVPVPLRRLDGISADRRTFVGATTTGQIFRATIADPVSGGPIPSSATFSVMAIGSIWVSRRRRC